MAELDRRHAEKALQRAEEMFLVGNIRGAQRQASTARRLCPSLAAATHALDAYDVHAAATAARPGGSNWRAVLGISSGAAGELTHADVKKRFRRLSVLVHPDRNSSAAAAGAFRLLLQAYDVLSAGTDGPRPWWMEPERQQQRPDGRRPPSRWKEPPCAFRVIYCRYCKDEFARPCGDLEEQAGMMCEDCHRWIRPPWTKKPAAEAPATKKQDAAAAAAPRPPPPEKPPVFPCPAQCPECGERYASNVFVGKWCLRCKACGKCSMVSVQGPDLATATKSGRTQPQLESSNRS